ncbi:type I-E CRISPR-associated protein Cas6/Cse3/CasE [Thetidibacter halocola]|uniref:Type I-E CRISPR-associated protein Cas6/Cse3/CasE n=1 Tax=Thetidibacter halocola TaxID=2827239 RepID=A0A8J7WHI3_9RHOB|nr:type I-E CRISPR-associated protein Cas6/Cse3/CasE [Thetidibacter halocola]MBS0126539.1 type I-E CRISPR-associated protein Cas6/Cse3/CasE [Thetidibacter halocola]
MTLFLSRVRLSRSPSARALAPLLLPSEAGRRRSAAHSLLWSVFADDADRRRDFLWREDNSDGYLTLSARPPIQTDLFQPHEVKEFTPVMAPGDRMEFTLRANATRMKKGGARVDVVMDALHGIPPAMRREKRLALATQAGADWLARQGEKAGFRVLNAVADDYVTAVLPDYRGPRKGQPQFGIIDLVGHLEVTDPEPFLAQLGKGFGRAKAFGCGLMLIRRAP